MLRAFRALVILNAIALALWSVWADNECVNNDYLQVWLQTNGLTALFRYGITGTVSFAIVTLILTFFRWKQLAGIVDQNIATRTPTRTRTNNSQS